MTRRWAVLDDGEGVFVAFDGLEGDADERFDIYLPADPKQRRHALAVIVAALNHEVSRPTLTPALERLRADISFKAAATEHTEAVAALRGTLTLNESHRQLAEERVSAAFLAYSKAADRAIAARRRP